MRKVPFGIMLAAVVFGPVVGLASEPASADPPWPSLVLQAEAAIAAKTGSPVPEAITPLSATTTANVQTVTGGVVQASETTFMATASGANYTIGLTLLGGQQLLVDYGTPGSSVIDVLTLVPGTSQIASAAQLSSQAGVQPDTSNCYPIAYSPTVVGTIYGPLIEGIGGAGCSYSPEVLGAIVALYSNGSGVGNASGGSSSPNAVYSYIAPYDYAPCYSSSANAFNTAVIYSVNGTVAGGGSSGNSWLDCQP